MQAVSVFAAAAVLTLTVVTGQDLVCSGSCVATWKKCAGEGIASGTMRPCCSEDDHCVQKTTAFSQCRPVSQDVPASWPSGDILSCTDPPACDPTTIVARLSGLSAGRFATNGRILLAFIFADELDFAGTTCLQECLDNEDCFAMNESVDLDCTLFRKNLFTTAGDLQPFFDSEIFLTKCFLPEPLCDPATREVRLVNPLTATDGLFHQMDANSDFSSFSVTPADYTLTAAINACRLNRDRLGGCIGFAIDAASERVTLLYPRGPGTRNYRSDLLDELPQVYSIEACL